MRRILLFLLGVIASITIVNAGKVTEQQALQKAQQFMKGKTLSKANAKSLSRGRSNDDAFYIFNAEDNDGFVIVSADDRTREILGYSMTGTLDMDNLPPNLVWWLEEYARQIKSLDTGAVAVKSSNSQSSMPAIEPMIQTKWGQYYPYWNMCPDGSGKDYYESGYDPNNRCFTGCAPTALAQILNYWKWPESCPALDSYISENGRFKFEVKALPATTFKWDKMKNSYSHTDIGESADAVAELMRYCGQAQHVNYSPYSSSSIFVGVPEVFNYSKKNKILHREDYSTNIWEGIIYYELAAGRPVPYSGLTEPFGATGGYGHQFIVDGYDGKGLFHINWGWDGNKDDYFVLSIAENFQYLQIAVIGVRPMREGAIAPYTVLSDDGQTVKFYYDGHMISRGGVELFDSSPYTTATTAVIDKSFHNYRPLSISMLFSKCEKLKSIKGLSNINTEYVMDMSFMFDGCSSLASLDLSGLNTDNVGDMSYMFRGCFSLTSLDLSGLNTDNVTNMQYMFAGCSNLTNIDLSGLNTGNVTNMQYLFAGCSSLASLDLSGLNTDNVGTMPGMFRGCSSLATLDLSGLNTDNVANMFEMFRDCSSLTSLDLSGFNTDNVGDMSGMFYDCCNLTSLDISSFNTNNVQFMKEMFVGCSSLKSLDLSGFNTDNVEDVKLYGYYGMRAMFCRCSSLTYLDLSNFDISKVTDTSLMFYGCSSLQIIFGSYDWNKSQVEMSEQMFTGCTALKGAIAYDETKTEITYANPQTGYFTIKGDVNNDGNVNAADIVYIIEYLKDGTVLPGFNEKAANADYNDKVDKNDVTAIKDIILRHP